MTGEIGKIDILFFYAQLLGMPLGRGSVVIRRLPLTSAGDSFSPQHVTYRHLYRVEPYQFSRVVGEMNRNHDAYPFTTVPPFGWSICPVM